MRTNDLPVDFLAVFSKRSEYMCCAAVDRLLRGLQFKGGLKFLKRKCYVVIHDDLGIRGLVGSLVGGARGGGFREGAEGTPRVSRCGPPRALSYGDRQPQCHV